jgi:hypothetical protein
MHCQSRKPTGAYFMADPNAGRVTQLRNIQTRTGRSIQSLHADVLSTGLVKVGERRSWLMERFKLGYGDANAVALTIDHLPKELAIDATPSLEQSEGDPLDTIYSGTKAHLRTLHDGVIAVVSKLGSFEQTPKKGYISLRRKKQFAMVGPATKDTIEIGLNAKNLPISARLKSVPSGGMCQAKTRITSLKEIDASLVDWIKQAFDAAG